MFLKKTYRKREKTWLIWSRYRSRCHNIFSIWVTWKPWIHSTSKCFLRKKEERQSDQVRFQSCCMSIAWLSVMDNLQNLTKLVRNECVWCLLLAFHKCCKFFFINKSCEYIHTNYKYFPFFIFGKKLWLRVYWVKIIMKTILYLQTQDTKRKI